MTLALSLILGLYLSADEPDGPSPPAVTDPGPQAPAQKPADSKKRLSRKDDKKSTAIPESLDDDAPVVEDDGRVPMPEDAKPASELDEKLLEELGGDLQAGQEEEDLVTKIAKNMRDSEERLARAQEDAETIQIQEQIVADLQKFLEEAQRQQQQNDPNQKMSKTKKKRPLTPEEQQRLARLQREKQLAAMKEGRQPANKPGPPRSAQEKLSPQPEDRAIWGHLSDLMRAEMNQYAKENFLSKYRDLIERYYTDIARRSQSSGD